MAHPDGSLTRPLVQRLISILLICFSQAIASATPSVNRAAVLDFDGDGKTDYAIIRSVDNGLGNCTSFVNPFLELMRAHDSPLSSNRRCWWILYSSGSHIGLDSGVSDAPSFSSYAVPGDYDGDGKWDIASWYDLEQQPGQGAFFRYLSSETSSMQEISWGSGGIGDRSGVTQDFDGDGKVDLTVVRGTMLPLTWYILESRTGTLRVERFGSGQDRLIRGDYDGDGKADVAVYRTVNADSTPANTFFILRSSDRQLQVVTFGDWQTDRIVSVDFDGDGKTDIAVTRPENGKLVWYWLQSSNGAFRAAQFGLENDKAAPGDYDGDGKTDLAVYRYVITSPPFSTNYFIVDRSRDGLITVPWGARDDSPPL